MSAVSGILYLDGGLVDKPQVDRMLSVLAHRGPDGRSALVDGPAALVYHRLATTPESWMEMQPLWYEGAAITADARIDNREELAHRLGISAKELREIGDGELIARAYRRWGEDCASSLLGDFAFAIWDSRTGSLFCARDHLGVKPFYFHYKAGRWLIVASEMKAILCHPEVPRTINETKIADFLLADFSDNASTFYSHILRLPPGSSLFASRDTLRTRRYWTLDPEREILCASEAEYAESFREIFTQAVGCRLRSPLPVGSLLSGGLDSSSIACVAHDLTDAARQERLHTFSIVFDRIKRSDERDQIREVLDGRRFESHLVPGDSLAPLDDLDAVLWHQDEPFFAPNLFLARRVWHTARESGVRVLLDGLFGDNVVSHGVEHLNELAQRWHWFTLARELRLLIRASGRDVPLHRPFLAYALQRGILPYVPEAASTLLRKVRRTHRDFGEQMSIFALEFAERARIVQRLARQASEHRMRKGARRAHADSLTCGMIETALEIYDKGCAEFGVETRFPFSDKRVVEFCVGIPGSQKIGQGFSRIILRRALRGCLPDTIRWRSDKGDLGWSFLDGLGRSLPQLESAIRSCPGQLDTIVDKGYVERLLARLRRGKAGDAEAILFHVALLSTWLVGAAAGARVEQATETSNSC